MDSKRGSKEQPTRTTVDSLSRSCFKKATGEKPITGPPKGAKYKLVAGCHAVSFVHTFDYPIQSKIPKGIADSGITTIKVHPACDYEFDIRRVVSEREIGDWGAALTLIDTLMHKHRADFVKGMSVLELGCGLGVPGMVCGALGAHVVLTDRRDTADHFHNSLEVLQENIDFNFMGPSNHPPGIGTGRVGLVEFTWGEEEAQKLVDDNGFFDFVICADTVYQPLYGKTAGAELAASLNILCGPQTECFISLQRRAEDNVEGFLDELQNKYHFLMAKSSSEFTSQSGTGTIEMYELRRLNNRELFHIDLQTSVLQEDANDIISVWRGNDENGRPKVRKDHIRVL